MVQRESVHLALENLRALTTRMFDLTIERNPGNSKRPVLCHFAHKECFGRREMRLEGVGKGKCKYSVSASYKSVVSECFLKLSSCQVGYEGL